jgi:class 3 adenylate cyclase
VTVVFCDLCDSTQLGERIDPETLRGVLASYFRAMSAVLERHDGTVEKFIGDAVMAVFGVPGVREDDALRAVRAAAEMRTALAELNAELEPKLGIRLRTRTGVNTGEVIAGVPSRGGGFVSGDAVNVAARLEQAAEPGEVLIGEHTLELVRGAVTTEPVAPLELKGKSRRVPAFRLLDVDVTPGIGGTGLTAPLVGRDRELAELHAALDRATERRTCELLTVLGPAGIGKSRLAQDFAAAVGERATVAVGRCVSYGEGLTFWPLRGVVAALAGSADEERTDVVRTGLARILEGDEDAGTVGERIAGAVGWGDPATDPLETAWAVRRLLEAAARERPLVVVLEDLHWAEPILLDLVEHVTGTLDGVPVLVVALAREDLLDLRPGFGGDAPRVVMAPLDARNSRALVEHLLGHDDVAGDLADLVFARAEGNPLFVEELVRMLVDERQLERSEAGVSAVRSSPLSLPPTIHALLAARIDRLAPGERTVVEAGAVVGAAFGRGALLALAGDRHAAEVDAHLDGLARSGLLAPDGGRFAGDPTYSFGHALMRDVAYGAMLKARRADLHARYADWLERTAGDRADEHDELLGYHLERAHRYLTELGPADDRARLLAARAARRLGASGARALARGDIRAAVSLLERAVSLLDAEDPVRRELTTKLGIALAETGQVSRVDALLRDRLEAERRGGAFVMFHDADGRQHVVDLGETATIGRRTDRDVALTWDDEVSRRHAHITAIDDGWELADDESRNGTHLNGQRLTAPHALRDGDVLRFGDTVVLFRAPARAPAHAGAAPGPGQRTHVPGRSDER